MNQLFPEIPDRSKTINVDEHIKKLFDENIWNTISAFSNHLEYIYTIYV
jgi:hypothetical protein